MKTNDYLLTASVGLYSFLFYQQNAGINFVIFNMLLIIFLVVRNMNLLSSPKWIWAALMALLSSACIVIHSSALSIFANVVSLLLLSAFSFNIATSSIFSFLFSIYTIMSSIVFVIIDAVTRSSENKNNPGQEKNYKWLGIVIVVFISIIFFGMYKNSNPLFAEYTKWINLDFVSIGWFFFTVGGFFLMYSFLYHRSIGPIQRWENALRTVLQPATDPELKKLETEKISLITLFTLLNVMLAVINMGDINTILLNGKLPEGIKHSDFVHSGVGTLIFSIVLAIAIIMYFLRGELNFYKGKGIFKFLILLWIFQNLLMLASTSFRNHLYISEYTLTYRRIGVYVWLALAMVGLVLTGIKIYYNKTNWYLIKSNFAVWFSILSLSCAIDWDLLITRYNLQNKAAYQIDYYYLFSLSETNIPELLDYCEKRIVTETRPAPTSEKERETYYYYSHFDYLNLLNDKMERYLRNYNKDWRSWDLRDERILKALKLND